MHFRLDTLFLLSFFSARGTVGHGGTRNLANCPYNFFGRINVISLSRGVPPSHRSKADYRSTPYKGYPIDILCISRGPVGRTPPRKITNLRQLTTPSGQTEREAGIP